MLTDWSAKNSSHHTSLSRRFLLEQHYGQMSSIPNYSINQQHSLPRLVAPEPSPQSSPQSSPWRLPARQLNLFSTYSQAGREWVTVAATGMATGVPTSRRIGNQYTTLLCITRRYDMAFQLSLGSYVAAFGTLGGNRVALPGWWFGTAAVRESRFEKTQYNGEWGIGELELCFYFFHYLVCLIFEDIHLHLLETERLYNVTIQDHDLHRAHYMMYFPWLF